MDNALPAVTNTTPPHDMALEGLTTPPPTSEFSGVTHDILALPIYLHLPTNGLRQTHLLVSLTLRANEEGTVVKAIVACVELTPPFARPGRSASAFVVPGVAVFIPSDILASPVYIVLEKLRGIRLKVRTTISAWTAKFTVVIEAIGRRADLYRMAAGRPLYVRSHRGPQARRQGNRVRNAAPVHRRGFSRSDRVSRSTTLENVMRVSLFARTQTRLRDPGMRCEPCHAP